MVWGVGSSIFDVVIPKTPLYEGIVVLILKYNTCDTEKTGTATCIKGNPLNIDNKATNFSLTGGEV